MSAMHHSTTDETTHRTSTRPSTRPSSGPSRRRSDLDHDLVAVLGMVAILALTALCFLGRTALPL